MRRILTLALAVGLLAAACGDADDEGAAGADDAMPTVVVTTNTLGDVVASATGGLVEVEVVMPRGADPHDFAPSAKAATGMENADLLVVNGAGFEAGMDDVIDAVEASGTPVFAFADVVELRDGGHDEDHDDDHDDAAHDDHEHAGADPHLWTDPTLVATGVEALGARLAELDGVDAELLSQHVADYVAELGALDQDIADLVESIPADRRVLVTNHEVFGYFADRYGFEVVGAIVPSLTTNAEASAQELEALADAISAEGVPAIFVETTQSTRLAESLAAEVGGDVELVELYAESLGEPDGPAATYVGMMRYNAEAIAEALAA